MALKKLRANCYSGSHGVFERKIRVYPILQGKATMEADTSCYTSSGSIQIRRSKWTACMTCVWCAKYEDGRLLLLEAVSTIARQLLLGSDFLHTECGIIHIGIAQYGYNWPGTSKVGCRASGSNYDYYFRMPMGVKRVLNPVLLVSEDLYVL